ncbi:MAG: hypothetical protein ACNI25_03905 [Halarcobacter sp.]
MSKGDRHLYRWSAGFWSGFAASGFAAPSSWGVEKGTMFTSLVSGTVSEISGGKFANGAVTGAFVHLFNAEGGTIIKKTVKNFVDLFDGVMSIPKMAYAYGDYLGRLSGFRDWQEGNILPANKWEAEIEYKLTVYAVKNHPEEVADYIWNDVKSRPYYYLGGSAAALSGSGATSVGVFIIHKTGSVSDTVHTKVNPFH